MSDALYGARQLAERHRVRNLRTQAILTLL